MIRADMIPDEVVEAMSEADHGTTAYAELLAAALNAWPRMWHYRGGWEPVVHNNRKPHIILPLPQEARDE